MPRTVHARILVVGGHTRNIGKTALIVDLIRAFPDAAWTAGKITQFGHGVCSRGGAACDCAPDEHTVALDWESDASTGTDSARFLEAGAERSLWLRTKQGRLAEGLPLLREALAKASGGALPPDCPRNVILESNSLLQFMRPSIYLAVLDPQESDFKDSARLFLDRADALIFRRRPPARAEETAKRSVEASWLGVSSALLAGRPVFVQPENEPLPQDLVVFLRERFFNSPGILF
ncbi:MAG TPA: hypothetical protein VEU31_02965 [Candidatus Acidoferrales bacterium]|nr:hypothetical protein [Candidatus Acidoferrales bacterium]